MSVLNIPPGDTAGNGYRSTGEITAAEGEAYRLLVIGLPASLSTWAGPENRLLACIEQYRGYDLGSWTCSKIYKSLTGRPAMVTVAAWSLLIRDAFQTLWEYIPVNADAHDGDRPQGLCKACEALSSALEAVAPGAVDSPEWVDRGWSLSLSRRPS